jgi:TolB-like protein
VSAILLALLVTAILPSGRRNGPEHPSQVSIAILPLESLSSNADQEYLADAITDALITDLAKIKSLRVISRSSVQQFKRTREPIARIARALGVDYVLEGTMLPLGDRLRITAQLIATDLERHVCDDNYERLPGEILSPPRQRLRRRSLARSVSISRLRTRTGCAGGHPPIRRRSRHI